MTSTYLGYRIYANDLTASLQHVAAEPANANDQAYYDKTISTVTSVDGFLNNYRLFNHAMTAFGLQDLGNAKALMKKVLESNLADPHSFANSLNDSRYSAFAKAFNFTSKGAVAASGQVQTSAQRLDLLSRINPLNSQTAGLTASLDAVTSVASLESNASLYDQVLSAYGLDPKTTQTAQVTLALESDLSNPFSYANQPGNGQLRSLAEAFNFASDGSIGSQRLLQSSQDTAATQSAYASRVPADAASQAAAAKETAYYGQKLPTLTSVDQLLADPRLVSYVKTAFGLDASVTTTQLRGVLTSNLLDPKSTANTLGVDPKAPNATTTNQLLAGAFSIGTDGTAFDHGSALPAAALGAATTAYTASVGTSTAAAAAGQTETSYFTSAILSVRSVAGLLADSRLVAYVKTAFALPNATTSDLGTILRSDLLDPKSAANTMGGAARSLAAAFDFAPDGLVYAQRAIQTTANTTATTTAYTAQAGTTPAAVAAAKTETDYFTTTVPRLKSVDDLLSDKRLVAYVEKAYGVPTTTSAATLRQVLTSNLADPKSKAATLGGGYRTLAAAFDISPDGSITHAPARQVQTKTGMSAVHDAYLEQSLETEAGAQNDGVRLALYFKRVAPTITSAYSILADKALTKVVQTMLGLSSTSSKADIDSQARTITSKLNLADFKNPQKLDKLVARFAALYDLSNSSDTGGTTAASGTTLSLFV